MRTVIEVRGVRATIEGGEWSCDDPEILRLCEALSVVRILEYAPDRDLQMAILVAQALDGEVVETTPTPFNPAWIY